MTFVGVSELKRLHTKTMREIFIPASLGAWSAMHHAHFDWWMFPVCTASSHGDRFQVSKSHLEELVADADYLAQYRKAIQIAAAGWGWSLDDRGWLPVRHQDQRWQGWPIRLYKMTMSAGLFGQSDQRDGLIRFAHRLLDMGQPFLYGGQDLGDYFRGAMCVD